jgi:hypothetical protein
MKKLILFIIILLSVLFISGCQEEPTGKFAFSFKPQQLYNCIDNDNDGYGSGCKLGPDCNDEDSFINPSASELCKDKIDNNCNTFIDENCEDFGYEGYCGDGIVQKIYDDWEQCETNIDCWESCIIENGEEYCDYYFDKSCVDCSCIVQSGNIPPPKDPGGGDDDEKDVCKPHKAQYNLGKGKISMQQCCSVARGEFCDTPGEVCVIGDTACLGKGPGDCSICIPKTLADELGLKYDEESLYDDDEEEISVNQCILEKVRYNTGNGKFENTFCCLLDNECPKDYHCDLTSTACIGKGPGNCGTCVKEQAIQDSNSEEDRGFSNVLNFWINLFK